MGIEGWLEFVMIAGIGTAFAVPLLVWQHKRALRLEKRLNEVQDQGRNDLLGAVKEHTAAIERNSAAFTRHAETSSLLAKEIARLRRHCKAVNNPIFEETK